MARTLPLPLVLLLVLAAGAAGYLSGSAPDDSGGPAPGSAAPAVDPEALDRIASSLEGIRGQLGALALRPAGAGPAPVGEVPPRHAPTRSDDLGPVLARLADAIQSLEQSATRAGSAPQRQWREELRRRGTLDRDAVLATVRSYQRDEQATIEELRYLSGVEVIQRFGRPSELEIDSEGWAWWSYYVDHDRESGDYSAALYLTVRDDILMGVEIDTMD